jgi:hypothetical protein
MADLTQFDLGSAARVARVVRAVEQEPRRTRPLAFSPVIEAGRKRVFRVCTFTGGWSINTAKTVTFKYQTATPNTVSATNLFANIATASTAFRNCAIARDGTAWFLIAAEC